MKLDSIITMACLSVAFFSAGYGIYLIRESNRRWKKRVESKQRDKKEKFLANGLLVLALLVCCANSAHAGDYNEGWVQGWEAGWKQIRGSYSLAPLPPLPPLPPLGEDDYKSGFAAGVLSGAAAAEKRQ